MMPLLGPGNTARGGPVSGELKHNRPGNEFSNSVWDGTPAPSYTRVIIKVQVGRVGPFHKGGMDVTDRGPGSHDDTIKGGESWGKRHRVLN